jgi:hypothetical protein
MIIPTRRRQRSHALAVLLLPPVLVVAHVGIVERGDHLFDHGLEKQALARGRLPVLRELLLVEHELPAHEVTIRHCAHDKSHTRRRT